MLYFVISWLPSGFLSTAVTHYPVRFPRNTSIKLKQGDLLENVKIERDADVNIFTIEKGMNIEDMVKIVNQSRISAVFCADSEFENVLV